MKKHVLVLLCFLSLFLLASCSGDTSQETTTEEEKVYLEDSQINDLFSNPSDFTGKYVKLKGKIFTAPETDGDTAALQIWYDPVNAEQNYIVYTISSESFNEDDYVLVDGKVDGEFEGENLMGGTVKSPLITNATVERSTYMDVVVPTIKEITPEKSKEQHDFKITMDKVEFADQETRIYLTLTNNSSQTIYAGVYGAKIIQDGKQIAADDNLGSAYEGNYPELDSEVLAGASASGIIVFPATDSEKDFKFVLPDISSDDYEIEFKDFEMKISVD